MSCSSIKLTEIVNQRGSAPFSGVFYDKNGSPSQPDSVKYSLNDSDGNIINGIDNLDLVGFSTTWELTLSGDDTDLSADETDCLIPRHLTITAFYGTEEDTVEAEFKIRNLVGIKN